MIIFRVILFLGLLAVSFYYILKLFSRLSDINMFSAMAWSFRAKVSKPVVLLPLVGMLLYLIIFFMLFFIFFKVPRQVFKMKKYHVGGLLGYRDAGLEAKLYDPSQRTYVTYEHLNPPFPADKFTETFEVVLLYKPNSSNYYQNTDLLKLPMNLLILFISALLLVVLYLMLYALAKEYISMKNLHKELSHHFMLTQFSKIVGLPLGKVLMIVIFVIVLILGLSAISVKRLMNHYSDLYESDQENLRSALLEKVSPQDTLKGVVIRRFQQIEKEYHPEGTYDDRGFTRDRDETTYYTVFHYTIEFKNLIQTLVYLDLPLRETREEINELDRTFPDKKAVIPNEMKEFTFIVNPDYSISLKSYENKSEE